MKDFKEYIKNPVPLVEHLSQESRKQANFVVDSYFSPCINAGFHKSQPEIVGWYDGAEGAVIRNKILYNVGIQENDSVLDVGCGVAHFYNFLESKGWNGEYLGIDPNRQAIMLIDEYINTKCGTIEDLDDTKYDWVIASGVFNIGLQESITFWTIHNMICRAKKGVVFNMLRTPYFQPIYESYDPKWVKTKLSEYDNREIRIVDGYFNDNSEFTVYFYI